MIEERVKVVRKAANGVWIEGVQQSACQACTAKSGCGHHTMSQLGRRVCLWLETPEILDVGEQVIIGLPEGALAKSALAVYGLPLVAMVLGAMLGHVVSGETGAITASLLGLLIGFGVAKSWSNANKSQWHPILMRRCRFEKHNMIHSA